MESPAIPGRFSGNGGGGGGDDGGGGIVTTIWSKIETQGVCDNSFCFEGNEFEIHSITGALLARQEGVPSTGVMFPNRIIFSRAPNLLDKFSVKETDGILNSDDNFEYVTYTPNYAGPIPVASQPSGFSWPLKESPNLSPFDPYTVGVSFTW